MHVPGLYGPTPQLFHYFPGPGTCRCTRTLRIIQKWKCPFFRLRNNSPNFPIPGKQIPAHVSRLLHYCFHHSTTHVIYIHSSTPPEHINEQFKTRTTAHDPANSHHIHSQSPHYCYFKEYSYKKKMISPTYI